MVDHTYTSSDYDKGSIFSFKGWSSGSHQWHTSLIFLADFGYGSFKGFFLFGL